MFGWNDVKSTGHLGGTEGGSTGLDRSLSTFHRRVKVEEHEFIAYSHDFPGPQVAMNEASIVHDTDLACNLTHHRRNADQITTSVCCKMFKENLLDLP